MTNSFDGPFKSVKGIASSVQGMARPFLDLTAEIREAFYPLLRMCELSDEILKSGWVPHDLLPEDELIAFLDADGPDLTADLNSHIFGYILDNNDSILGELQKRIDTYNIESDERAIASQIVAAHRFELYSCVGPTVFSLIELCIRRLQAAESGFAIKKALLEIQGNLPANTFPLISTAFLTAIDDHLYASCFSAEEAKRFRFLPNRHSIVHGWIDSDELQISMNAILMLDHVLSSASLHKSLNQESP